MTYGYRVFRDLGYSPREAYRLRSSLHRFMKPGDKAAPHTLRREKLGFSVEMVLEGFGNRARVYWGGPKGIGEVKC